MTTSIGFVTRQYISQSTALSSKQHFHEALPFPAVTLCNKNLNRKSVAAVDTGIYLTLLTIFLNSLLGNPYLADDSFDLEDLLTIHLVWKSFSSTTTLVTNWRTCCTFVDMKVRNVF